MGYPALMLRSDEAAENAAENAAEDAAEEASDTIGGRLIRARAAKALTTSQLARRIGVKTQTLHNWETDRTAPRSNRLAMLAGVLNVSPTWVLVGRGEAPLVDDDAVSDDNPEGLLKLRESIQGKIEELHRIMAEVDDMIENSTASL